MQAPEPARAGPLPATAEEARVLALAERPIREILFCSDLSRASELAFGHARLLSEALDARLTLYHAAEPPQHAAGDAQPRLEAWRRAEGAAHERLSHWISGARVESHVVVESAPSAREAVLEFLRVTRPDLCVLATHGREGLARFLLGSVTEAALHQAVCPILCVREPLHGSALPYRRLLVPSDLTEASRPAFPIAGVLARAFGAEVLALHVAPLPEIAGSAALASVANRIERELPDEAGLLALVRSQIPGVHVTPRVELGSPWQCIVETARVERADLIVMTTHGQDSVRDRILGSHAERVVRRAPCPVLVV